MKTNLSVLSKKLNRLQREVRTHKRTITDLRKAEDRRFFGSTSRNADAREDRFRPSTAEDYLQLFESYVHVFACVHAIARNCARLPLRIYQLKKLTSTKDRRGDEITDGPVWNLLNQPNPFTSGYGLIYSMIAFTKLAGTSYLEKVGSETNITELWALRPDWMRIRADAEKLIDKYEYTVDGQVITYQPEEILRFKEFHPRSELYGLSNVSPVVNSVITDLYAMKYTKQFFQQGGHLNWYIKIKEELSDESFKRLEQQIKTKFAGLENAHSPAVLDNDGEIKELGQSPDRNTLLPQKTLSRDEVCEAFGVPALMLGLPNETHYNNAEEQKLFFWNETVKPVMKELVATFNRDIFWLQDLEVEEDYSDIPVLQSDEDTKATTSKTLVDGKIMTPNEVRQRFFQMEPLPEGDAFPAAPAPFEQFKNRDGIIVKMLELLISKGGVGSGHHNHYPSPEGRGSAPAIKHEHIRDIEKDIMEGRTEEASTRMRNMGIKDEEIKIILAQGCTNVLHQFNRFGIRTKKIDLEKKASVVGHKTKIVQAMQKDFDKLMVDGYRDMGKAVLSVVNKLEKSFAVVKKDIVAEAIGSLDPVTKRMAKDLLKLEKGKLRAVVKQEMERVKKKEPDEKLLDEIEKNVDKHLDRMVDESMKSVSDTTKTRVEKKFTDMLESNSTVATMTKEFEDLFEGTDREGSMWARTVARTEALKFAESSRFSTLSEMGYKKKEWFHSGHDDAREDHLAADGEVVDIDKKFSTGLMFPGDPVNGEAGDVVNCGCTFAEYVGAAGEEE